MNCNFEDGVERVRRTVFRVVAAGLEAAESEAERDWGRVRTVFGRVLRGFPDAWDAVREALKVECGLPAEVT